MGNGLMLKTIILAREISDGKEVLPAVLRTSDPYLDKKYSKVSDVRIVIGKYYIHGFGFVDKYKKLELFENAKKKFVIAASYVAEKSPTVVPIANYALAQK